MNRVRRILAMAAVLTFEIGAIVTLHRLGSIPWLQIPVDDLGGWLADAAPEDAVAAIVRHAGLAIAYWMALTTATYAAGRVLGLRRAVRSVAFVTLPGIRRIVDAAVAASVTVAAFVGPTVAAGADEPQPIVIEIDDEGHPVPPGTSRDYEPGAGPPGLVRLGWTAAPIEIPPPDAGLSAPTGIDPTSPAASIHVVVPGDNLWTITAQHIRAAGVSTPSCDLIATHWREVIEINRPGLRSGNPDLIFPGELIELPALQEDSQ